MRVTLRFSSVVTQVGINPSDKPLSGSCAISGTGMNGAVAGLNHLVHPGVAAGGGTVTGPGRRLDAWIPRRDLRPAGHGQEYHRCSASNGQRFHRSNRAKECSRRSMSAAANSPIVEIRNKFLDKLPCPA